MPNVIDLFAGVGGLSLGAARAGFTVSGAVEVDDTARQTHALNFPECAHIPEDVRNLSAENLLEEAGILQSELDGLIGGPPCQGFSTIGSRRYDDSRNSLFREFFRLAAELQPKFIVAENVPGIMDERYESLRTEAFELVSDKFLILDPVMAVATDYGAPTTRTRYFFIGINRTYLNHERDAQRIQFIPRNFDPCPRVAEALSGLPSVIRSDWLEEHQGWRKVNPPQDKIHSYFFSRVMGNVPTGVGDRYSLHQYFNNGLVSGCLGTRHSTEVKKRYARLRPGQRDNVSRSLRLDPDGYCPTLRAGTGRERGSHQAVRPIHPSSPRVITPREAARLQGFPDWFRFHGTKWHSFRQIGNSVSPLVGEFILSQIHRYLYRTPDDRRQPEDPTAGHYLVEPVMDSSLA